MAKSFILLLGLMAVLATGLHIQENHQQLPYSFTIQADNGLYLGRCNNCAEKPYENAAIVYLEDPTQPEAIWYRHTIKSNVFIVDEEIRYLEVCLGDCYPSSKKASVVVKS